MHNAHDDSAVDVIYPTEKSNITMVTRSAGGKETIILILKFPSIPESQFREVIYWDDNGLLSVI